MTFLICDFMEDLTDLLRAVRTLSWRSRFDALRVFGITLKFARDLYFKKLTIHQYGDLNWICPLLIVRKRRRFGSFDNPNLRHPDDLRR